MPNSKKKVRQKMSDRIAALEVLHTHIEIIKDNTALFKFALKVLYTCVIHFTLGK